MDQFEFFRKNRLVDPQDIIVAILIVITIIRILENQSERILDTIGQTRVFQKSRLVHNQGYILGDFDAQIYHQGCKSLPEIRVEHFYGLKN